MRVDGARSWAWAAHQESCRGTPFEGSRKSRAGEGGSGSFITLNRVVQDGPCRKRNNLLPSSSPFDRAVALPRASWHQRDTSRSLFRASRRAEPPAPPPQTQASGCCSTDPRRSSPPRRVRI